MPSGGLEAEADHSCAVSCLPQERVSSIHPQDLMQIVSHTDSRDKHRVRDCGLRVGLDLHPMQGGWRPRAARLSSSGVTNAWMWFGFLAPAAGGQWRPHREMHAGRGPYYQGLGHPAWPPRLALGIAESQASRGACAVAPTQYHL